MNLFISAVTQSCVLITLNYIALKIRNKWLIEFKEKLSVPFLTGVASIVMMFQPFPEGVLLNDLRFIPTMMAGLRFGFVACSLSIILPAAYDMIANDATVWGAVQSFIFPLIISSFFHRHDYKDSFTPISIWDGFKISILLLIMYAFKTLALDGIGVTDWLNGIVSVNVVSALTLITLIAMVNDENRSWLQQRNLELKAYQDSLTKLPNFRSFKGIAKSTLKSRPISIMMIDIDSFKIYNDNLGHQLGDQLLNQVGTLLQHSIGEKDYLARYGGEEFVLMCNSNIPSQLEALANDLCRVVSSHDFTGMEVQPHQCITISIGISIAKKANENLQTLIGEADEALYRSKGQGKNRYTLHFSAEEAQQAQ